MDFRYSRTQRSRDIKLYLILWFIWSCIWWCWFLKRSFNCRDFRHCRPQIFQRYKTWFHFLIYLMFYFMLLVLVFIARYLAILIPENKSYQQHGFCTQSWLEIKLSLHFWYLLSRRHTCKSECILLENSGSWVPFAYIVGYLAKLGKICKSVVSTESHKLIWGRISSPIQSQICMSFISFGISQK